MSLNESGSSDKERDLIEKVARKIVELDIEFFALYLLQTIKPVVWITGELGYFFLAPFLPLLEDKGYDFLDTFEDRENIERLLKRVEQLSKEKKRENNKRKEPSLWDRLKKKLSISIHQKTL